MTLKYKKNLLRIKEKGGEEDDFDILHEPSFGQLKFHRSQTQKRKENDPLVTFRIEFETTEHVTEITKRGEKLHNVFILTVSMLGGLFTSISGITIKIVGFLVTPGFIAFMTNNLFLVADREDQKKKDPINDLG